MNITLKDKNGVILKTASKYCEEDIQIGIETEEININPSTEEQVKEGLFNKVTVPGDEDLVAENIKKGKNIFGVEGGFDAVDTRDATATSNDIAEGTTAYVNNLKVEGTVPNNGELQYEPSDEEQTIPAGLTSGGTVKATDITKLAEYEACLTLANSIDNLEDYTETTATAEDIREGKTAYSNGERITGELEVLDYNIKFDTSETTNNKLVIVNNITEIDFEGVDTTNFNSLYASFSNFNKLIKIKNLDTSNMVNFYQTFNACTKLNELPELNTSKATTMYGMFSNCYSLVTIPELDTKLVTDMSYMFAGCTSLKNIPLFDTSSVTTMKFMFNMCTGLSDESLNNILAMCTNAVNYAQTKTLSSLYLTSDQATICQGLSNYQAFLDAGWTTGY